MGNQHSGSTARFKPTRPVNQQLPNTTATTSSSASAILLAPSKNASSSSSLPPLPPAPAPHKLSVYSSSTHSGSIGEKTNGKYSPTAASQSWDASSYATTATAMSTNSNSSSITLDVQQAISTAVPAAQPTCNPEMKIASEVKPFLFLGGDQFVARNKEYLQQLKIKHIINCAGLSCEDYFEDSFTYTTLDLSDTSKECIFNFMLQTITDIEMSRKSGNNVLVHCVAGISRSATLVAAYLMFIHGYDTNEALAELRKVRPCVDPNPRFVQELDRFRRRLDWQPSEPTLHRIAPHSPLVRALVPKPVFAADNTESYSRPSIRHLHPRYTLVVHSPKDRALFLWVGPEAALQYEEERVLRMQSKQTRKRSLQAEPYDEAGPRIGLMMTQMDKPYARLGCNFVHVPTFTDSVPDSGFTSAFWLLLGVPVGTRVDMEFLRRNQQYGNEWTEVDGDFFYRDNFVPQEQAGAGVSRRSSSATDRSASSVNPSSPSFTPSSSFKHSTNGANLEKKPSLFEAKRNPNVAISATPSAVAAGSSSKEEEEECTRAAVATEEKAMFNAETAGNAKQLLALFPPSNGNGEDKPEPSSSAAVAMKREQGMSFLQDEHDAHQQQVEDLRSKRTRSQSLNFEASSTKTVVQQHRLSPASPPTPLPVVSENVMTTTPSKFRSKSMGAASASSNLAGADKKTPPPPAARKFGTNFT